MKLSHCSLKPTLPLGEPWRVEGVEVGLMGANMTTPSHSLVSIPVALLDGQAPPEGRLDESAHFAWRLVTAP